MKKIAIFSFPLFLVAVFFSGCRKEDLPGIPALTRFTSFPVILKVNGTDQAISAQDPASFNAKFTVDMFFKNEPPAQKLDVVVIKNGDKSVVKLIQGNITAYPTTLTITGTQLATLFGAPIVLGDKFDISVDVTAPDGTKYEGFPATGNAYASGTAAQPGASTLIRYEAACLYEPDQYQGNFVVVTDEWADYSPGDVIQLTKVDDTHFSFMYLAADPRPIVVTVNPNTNGVTVPKQVYGSGYPPGWTFGNISVESVPNVDNVVAPCAGTFSVLLQHSVAAGNFPPPVKIVLRKQ